VPAGRDRGHLPLAKICEIVMNRERRKRSLQSPQGYDDEIRKFDEEGLWKKHGK
jgi:hypothetical protein